MRNRLDNFFRIFLCLSFFLSSFLNERDGQFLILYCISLHPRSLKRHALAARYGAMEFESVIIPYAPYVH